MTGNIGYPAMEFERRRAQGSERTRETCGRVIGSVLVDYLVGTDRCLKGPEARAAEVGKGPVKWRPSAKTLLCPRRRARPSRLLRWHQAIGLRPAGALVFRRARAAGLVWFLVKPSLEALTLFVGLDPQWSQV